jgi:outer membrane protein
MKIRAFIGCLALTGLLVFSACDKAALPKPAGTDTAVATTAVATEPVAVADGSIVYVNIDTLMTRYKYYEDAKSKLEARYKTMNNETEGKVQALYKRAGELEAKVKEMTRQQLEEAQQSLAAEEASIQKLREQREKSFVEEQDKLDADLKKKLAAYFAELSKAKGYRLILSYTSAGLGVLYGDPSLDITNLVVSELNAQYKTNK